MKKDTQRRLRSQLSRKIVFCTKWAREQCGFELDRCPSPTRVDGKVAPIADPRSNTINRLLKKSVASAPEA
jgi:hypothetical protein